MRKDEIEALLAQLDLIETQVFRMVKAEPQLIRRPEVLDLLSNLESTMASLQAVSERYSPQAWRD